MSAIEDEALAGTGVEPADDYFHEPDDNPYWNESAWFGFHVPERRLTGFVYFFHRPNMNYSVGGVGFWDPSGEETYDCLYYDWGDTYAMPEGANMFDFRLPNGLEVECVEPIKTINLRYGGGDWYGGRGCEVDLQYNGFIYPHHTGYPKGQREWGPAKGHYEQPGTVEGTVILDGERIEIDTWCERDHSWGPRSLRSDARGNFPSGIASKTSAFQVYAISDLKPEEDPIAGTTEQIAAGWQLKDGKYGSFNSGEWRVTERRADGAPTRMEANAIDSLGREFYAVGKTTNNLQWHGYPYLWQWWGQVEWEYDGQTCCGEHMDFMPLQQGREFMRSLSED